MTTLTIQLHDSISSIPAPVWDRLAGNDSPFLSHAYLDAVESSGSACDETGWRATHFLAEDSSGQAVGAMPMYLKSHSMGEYVFDHAWAHAYQMAGGQYYPKLQSAVPFTPVGGPRLLVGEGGDRWDVASSLLRAACQFADQSGVSSLHVVFCGENEWKLGGRMGMLRREGTQMIWINRGYDDFDGFLAELSSKRRHQIRRERSCLRNEGVRFRVLEGDDIRPDHWDSVWAFYQDTGARKWGIPYLSREFFDRIHSTMRDAVVIMLAEIDGVRVAGALSFRGRDALYGRHWGALKYVRFLHFELCYYQAIEYAITRNIGRVEAGAGGEHKAPRGYGPLPTYSLHWIVDPHLRTGVEEFLQYERPMVMAEREQHQDRAYRQNRESEEES